MAYDIFVDGESIANLGVFITKRPNIPAPIRKYQEYDIPGRNGKMYEMLDQYEDIEITVTFNYMVNKDLWHQKFREIKKKLNDIKELTFSDDMSFFHIVKKVEIGTNERTSLRIGRFDVVFTLDPYYYLLSGKEKIRITNGKIFNQYDIAPAVYYITGEGMCTLTVNGHECECNVGQNLTIDTFLKLAYRDDGTLMNAKINGNYEDMLLIEGENDISITSGFILEIKPNWRCL